MPEGMIGGRRCVLTSEVSDNTAAGFPREITMAVVLMEKNGGPVEGQKVYFFFDGGSIPFHEDETKEYGRASVTFLTLRGGQKMTATVEGSGLSVTYTVPVEKKTETTVPVKDFDARTITVDEERGLERVSIRLSPPRKAHFRIEGGGVVHDGDTDEHGFVVYPPVSELPLHHDRKIKYVVEVEGVKRQEELLLEAPPLHPMPPPPPADLGFLRRWVWRLRHNNNWRMALGLTLTMSWFCFNVFVFGICTGDSGTAEWLRYQGMSEADRFFYETWHLRDGIPLPTDPSTAGYQWEWWCSWSWWSWFWFTLVNTIYVPVSLWDEFSRAWYRARKTVLERREGVSRGDAFAQPAGAGVPAGEQQGQRHPRSFFAETVMETFHEIVAEVAVHGLSRRFR